MKNKIEKLSIYDIKRLSYAKSPYFFDTKTLKFFGQTMRSFKVARNFESGIYFIIAPMKDRQGNQIGFTTRFFNPVTNELEQTKKDY